MYIDISFWVNKSNSIGVSINSIIINIIIQVISFNSGSLLKGTIQLVRISIEMWKLYCLFSFEFYWTLMQRQKARFVVKIVRIQHTNLMIQKGQKMTQSLDATALHCLAFVVTPLFIYFGFSLTKFGCVFMVAPQLYINYKMNMVNHISLNTIIYKSINIIIGKSLNEENNEILNRMIDDLFAFIIGMSITHRLSCAKDNIIFLIYFLQSHIKVNKKV